MTWIDVLLIVLWIIFISIGARMGSSWTAGCLIGGFIGAFAADYYALPFSEFLGGFNGAPVLAAILLFAGGLTLGLVPAWIIGKISASFLAGLFDSVFGLVTGLLTGFLAVSVILLWTMQVFSDLEGFTAWKKSKVARPMHERLEHHFETHGFRSVSFSRIFQTQTRRHMIPIAGEAMQKAKDLSTNVVHKLKKE